MSSDSMTKINWALPLVTDDGKPAKYVGRVGKGACQHLVSYQTAKRGAVSVYVDDFGRQESLLHPGTIAPAVIFKNAGSEHAPTVPPTATTVPTHTGPQYPSPTPPPAPPSSAIARNTELLASLNETAEGIRRDLRDMGTVVHKLSQTLSDFVLHLTDVATAPATAPTIAPKQVVVTSPAVVAPPAPIEPVAPPAPAAKVIRRVAAPTAPITTEQRADVVKKIDALANIDSRIARDRLVAVATHVGVQRITVMGSNVHRGREAEGWIEPVKTVGGELPGFVAKVYGKDRLWHFRVDVDAGYKTADIVGKVNFTTTAI